MRLLYLTILLFLSFNSIAQYFTIHGKVEEDQTLDPIAGAVIRMGELGVVTDMNGVFSLPQALAGLVLTVTMIGYEEKKYTILGTEENQIITLLLTPANNALGAVVISAGKFEQNLGEVTVSMEVIKPELIHDKNTISADEILQQTPGVSIVDGEPQIRSGSGYSFGAGSRVQILMDDIPVLSGDAGRPSWGFIPIENISQIEVIKGASSVLYGSAALSGVINMRSAYPSDKPLTEVTVFGGIFSKPKTSEAAYWKSEAIRSGVNFLHSQKFGQFDFVLGGSYLGDDGHLGPIKDTATGLFTDNNNLLKVDRYSANSRIRINSNMRYRSKKYVGLSYGINFNVSQSNSLATLLWENSSAGLYSGYEGGATRTVQLLSTVDPFIIYHTHRGGKHSIKTRWQSLDNDNDNDQGNFSDVLYGEYQYQQNWDSLHLKGLTTTFGVVGISTDARGTLYTGGNPDGKNAASNYASYLQVDKKFFNRLNVSAGVRYEYFEINKVSDSKPVFRAGLNYQFAKASFIRASYGQGFRFPTIVEKFITTGLGAINIFPNPDLVAETSYNAEVGLKQGFKIGGFYGFVDLAYFYQRYTNFIEFTFGQWKFVPPLSVDFDIVRFQNDITKSIGFKSVNTGKAQINGAELTVMGEGKIRNVKIQLLAGYTYAHPISLTPNYAYGKPVNGPEPLLKIPAEFTYNTTSSDTTQRILKYRLEHLIRGDINLTWKDFSLGFSYRYNSRMQNIDRAFEDLETVALTNFNPGLSTWRSNKTGPDFIMDTRISYNFNSHFRVGAVVNNILNREYAIRPLAIEEMRMTMLQLVAKF